MKRPISPEYDKVRRAALSTLKQQTPKFVEHYRTLQPAKPEHIEIFETLEDGFLARSGGHSHIDHEDKTFSLVPNYRLTKEAIEHYYGEEDTRTNRLKRWVRRKLG